jgi:hypothetical protein
MAQLQCRIGEDLPIVQKPFSPQTLLSVVRKTLDAKPQRQRASSRPTQSSLCAPIAAPLGDGIVDVPAMCD